MHHQNNKILVTGGTGYIGSHTIVALVTAGYFPIIVDNLSNSKKAVLERLAIITGQKIPFYQVDLRNRAKLNDVFKQNKIEGVIHFAGLKAVGESVSKPLYYYENNIESTLSLCSLMTENNVNKLIFSSSATVYGDPHTVPIKEDFPLQPTNPYGRTKLMIEQILQDIHTASPDWQIVLLRYFNPVGAHVCGLIGEDPSGIPNNLMPYISQVAVGRRERLNIFGNDYPTPDGTGVRDYIHVMDLAEGHVAALNKIAANEGTAAAEGTLLITNLGTGCGYSVLEMVNAFEQASGEKIPYTIVARRPGDIASCYADASRAKELLGWQAKRTLADMCIDSWNWQSQNPEGYA